MAEKGKRHPDRVGKDFSLRELVYEEPPPEAFRKRQSTKWGPITKALKTRPGRWYRLQVYEKPDSASSAVTMLKKLYPDGDFEFVHHEGKLWGRYLGTANEKVTSSQGQTSTTTTVEKPEHHRRVDEQESSGAGT